ncbi:hypothetical protein [Streptomyces sp. XY006]|uniref:hypothetical protein n=1 Tax=Streptomyces sp. XY006 TaxID=2021410 RepID=UPI000B8BB964|nr:hypothetical protein [Streptomyces sp. XY006]OXS36494.1 hypothetical protein CHR28_05915 [Streptomyces sp. XY006]
MTDLIARALEPLLGRLLPPRGRRRRTQAPPPCPYCRDAADEPAVSRPEVRPLRGEDNRLVRPYLSTGATA